MLQVVFKSITSIVIAPGVSKQESGEQRKETASMSLFTASFIADFSYFSFDFVNSSHGKNYRTFTYLRIRPRNVLRSRLTELS